jgi:arylsulfatase A-like enzyme
MSDAYLRALTRTDEAVGRVLAALPENTLVILTSDHGGHGLAHGSDLPEDMTIPWIVAGPGVRANHPLAAPIVTLDTAVTVVYVLGLERPETMTGQPVVEAFE